MPGAGGEGLFLTAASRSLLCLGPAIHFLTVLLHKNLYLISVSTVPLGPVSAVHHPAVRPPPQMHCLLDEGSGRNVHCALGPSVSL